MMCLTQRRSGICLRPEKKDDKIIKALCGKSRSDGSDGDHMGTQAFCMLTWREMQGFTLHAHTSLSF